MTSAGRAALTPPGSLRDLARKALDAGCPDGEVPRIERLCFADRWLLAQLSDGRAGRAFVFSGAHAVYGALDFARMAACEGLIGWRVDDALAWAVSLEPSGAGEWGGVAPSGLEDARPDDPSAPAFDSLKGSIALSLVNALSSELNAPSALEARGFELLPEDDRSFLREGDHVVLIGAGMLLHESAQRCARVDVIDMRPRAFLQNVVLDKDGMRTGPENLRFHGVEDTERLVAEADVVGITGCALENGTLFGIARLPSRAREFVVFGPSAQAPMECFAALGATLVLTSRVVDACALAEGMLESFGGVRVPGATEGYLVRVGVREG